MSLKTTRAVRALVLAGAAAALTPLTFPAIGTLAAQQDATVKLLQELTNANGAPGFEGPVRTILKREWQGILTDLRTDGLGNLLGSLPGGSESPRVLVMAHMDEVGFMVRYIDPNGFVYFQARPEPGASLYVTGLEEASSGKELIYFEIPLDAKE